MVHGQLCAALFVCLVGTLASPVKAAGFDEQAMRKAIALVDEIADLNVWFSFCTEIDFAHEKACRILHKKHEDKYMECFIKTCGDSPKPQACQKDCADRLALFKKGSEQCRQAFEKALQDDTKVYNQGSNNLKILPDDYFVRLGATSEQGLSLMYRRIEQERLVRNR